MMNKVTRQKINAFKNLLLGCRTENRKDKLLFIFTT